MGRRAKAATEIGKKWRDQSGKECKGTHKSHYHTYTIHLGVRDGSIVLLLLFRSHFLLAEGIGLFLRATNLTIVDNKKT